MKIIFCGTPHFALPCFNSILASSHEILAVITQPDRPAGRGRKLHQSVIKEAACAAGLPVFQPARIGESNTLAKLKQMQPDIMVVVAYGQLLPKEVLDLPKYGCINVHASLLPYYRGAAPINWAIIKGEQQTGITTMRLDEGMDTGNTIIKQVVDITPRDTAGSLHDKLAPIGAETLIKTLEQIENNTICYYPQDDSKASYAPALQKSDTVIDWTQSAKQIDCFIRGLNPYPGAKTTLNGENFKIFKVEMSDEAIATSPSTIIRCNNKKGILVATGSTPVWLITLQPPNRSIMNASNYLSGLKETIENKKFDS